MLSFSISRFRLRTLSFAVACIATGLLISGCADQGVKLYKVTGKVMLNGVPVEASDSMLMFIDQAMNADTGTAKLNSDGQYSLMTTAGRKRVEIRCTREVRGKRPGEEPHMENFIPAKYNRESTLEVEVRPDDANVFDFDLKT